MQEAHLKLSIPLPNLQSILQIQEIQKQQDPIQLFGAFHTASEELKRFGKLSQEH